jgi:hypothetical protein
MLHGIYHQASTRRRTNRVVARTDNYGNWVILMDVIFKLHDGRHHLWVMQSAGACEKCAGRGKIRRVVLRDRRAQRWLVQEFAAGAEPDDSVVVSERECPVCKGVVRPHLDSVA